MKYRVINSRTPQDFTGIASHDPNVRTVADSIYIKRRRDRTSGAAAAGNASRSRGFIDPTTSDKDLTEAELEFMRSMKLYQQASGRMFPTWSEVLEVLKGLGYAKVPAEPMKGE